MIHKIDDADKAVDEMARLISCMEPRAKDCPVVMLYAARMANGACCSGFGVSSVEWTHDSIPIAVALRKTADQYIEALVNDLPSEHRETVRDHIQQQLCEGVRTPPPRTSKE